LAVKIRLTRRGAKKAPYYRIIVIDSRKGRDGRFLEKLGTYNPLMDPPEIVIDRDATIDWLKKGAIPSQTVSTILKKQDISI